MREDGAQFARKLREKRPASPQPHASMQVAAEPSRLARERERLDLFARGAKPPRPFARAGRGEAERVYVGAVG